MQHLCGESAVTPNMHLHAHLKSVILDYGPLQEFWCFSFERFNGILGNQPSNNRCIEPQLMKRFLSDSFTSSIEPPKIFQQEFNPIFATFQPKFVGSISETIDAPSCKLGLKYTRAVLSPDEISNLGILFTKLSSSPASSVIEVNAIFMKFSSVVVKGKTFSSSGKKTTPVVAMALWDERIYGKQPTPLPDPYEQHSNICPVNVHYYAKVTYTVDDVISYDILAFVSWFFPHPQRYALGKPMELWCRSIFEPVNYSCSFVPLQNIICRCAHGIKLHQHEHLLLVVPLAE